MSYCRFSNESDVYVFPATYGGITCCACSLAYEGLIVNYKTPIEMLAHLARHYEAGHIVPASAINRLCDEA